MRGRIIPCIILAMLLTATVPALIFPVHAKSNVPLKVTRAAWGTSLNSPIEAYPDDAGVALTVEVQNLSPNQTIKGVSGLLNLTTGPFTDIYGNLNASATGAPTIGEILNPTDEIKPKGFLTMTFTLNIDENAIPGAYTLSMNVSYSASEGMDFIEGVPQILFVTCQVSFAESTVTVSASPTTLDAGETVRITGNVAPAKDNVTITLAYKRPDDTEFTETAKTKPDGSFSASYKPQTDGLWTLNASWAGDDKYLGNWGLSTFEVRLSVSMAMTLSNNRLKAGYDDSLNITLENNGEVALSDLQVSVTIPAPLLNTGENQWTMNFLDVGNSFSVSVEVFVPSSSIGSTYSGGLTVSCRDDYGGTQTFNFPVGLIIVGNVELNAYDSTVKPQLVKNGSKVEITMTLLNKGTVSALYVNASILPNPILVLTPASSVYVGDVEENSQTPFTLTANVSSATQEGTYPVIVKIWYRNDQNIDNSFEVILYVPISTNNASSHQGEVGVSGILSQVGAVLATVIVATSVLGVLYRKQSRKKNQQARSDK